MHSLTRLSLIICLIGCCIPAIGQEPKVELLWPDGAPGALGEEPKDKPTLICYPATADTSTGTAIIICPGGGYSNLAMDHEGHQIARWLNKHGISAFICDYRHRKKGYGHPAPLQDVQRAQAPSIPERGHHALRGRQGGKRLSRHGDRLQGEDGRVIPGTPKY